MKGRGHLAWSSTLKRIALTVALIAALTALTAFATFAAFTAGHGSHVASATSAPPPVTVGLNMNTTANSPAVFGGSTLPRFAACVDVKTAAPQNGIFYIDVFVLRAQNLVAFSADLGFTPGKMQILQANVKELFNSTATNWSNYTDPATNPPGATTPDSAVISTQLTPASHCGLQHMTQPATPDPACWSASRHRLSLAPA